MRLVILLVIVSTVSCQNGLYRDKFTRSLKNFTGLYYHQIQDKDANKNFMFSPLSIYQAMGMVLAGAKGNTEIELRNAMDLPYSVYGDSRIDNLMGKSYYHSALRSNGQIFRLANGLFIQNDFKILQSYVDVLTDEYRVEVQHLNFKNESASRSIINEWISRNTNGKIKKLVGEGELSPLTKLVLANAIYFEAQWQTEFKPTAQPILFQLKNKEKVKANFMTQRGKFLTYLEPTTNTSFIAIPYQSKEPSTTYMILAWPKDGIWTNFDYGISELLTSFDLNTFKREEIVLNIPYFKITSSHNVVSILRNLGVMDLFDDKACNLTGISDEHLYVTRFEHKAHLEVDEKGTVAAAASKVVFVGRSVDRTKVTTLDHPFFFGIYSERAFSFTFVGKLNNPLEST